MNLLLDGAPKTVLIGGVEYPLNWEFRTSILFELMIQSDELSDKEKLVQALQLYYGDGLANIQPQMLQEAVKGILWFYSCGKPDQKMSEGRGDDDGDKKQAYSFEYDDAYIYAAFMSQYGIDLERAEGLHWWKFRAMFEGLKDDEKIVKIMGYRTAKTAGMTKEQRTFYSRMQRLYALPCSKKEKEQQDALIAALQSGGDVSVLLDGGTGNAE